MALDDPSDYTAMSGGEFKHAVGADPAKWAEAFLQRAPLARSGGRDDQLRELTGWFSDCMEAARANERRYQTGTPGGTLGA